MFRTKFMLVIIAVLMLISTTAVSYAFWNSLSVRENVQTPIGKGFTLNVSVSQSIPAGKTLIPPDAVAGEDDITQAVLKYNVSLDKKPAQALTLSVTYDNVRIDGQETYAELVIITVSTIENITDALQEITVTISLAPQAEISEEAYNAINSKDITFDLLFLAQ